MINSDGEDQSLKYKSCQPAHQRSDDEDDDDDVENKLL
jgi:hypothetical protein